MTSEKIRVALVDDQDLIRLGFKALIETTDDLVMVGEASNGAGALEMLVESPADVVLMDIRMPGVDGIAATRAICEHPELESVRVVVLTTFELDEYVVQAIQAGASGFLGKGVGPEELLAAIRTVAAGNALLSPKATRTLLSRFSDETTVAYDASVLEALTEREREMMGLAAHGLTNEEIANRSYLSPLTVKTHLNRAMMKLGARDRAQLVVIAYRSGLVQPGDNLA